MATNVLNQYQKNQKRPWSEFRPVMFSAIVGMHLLAVGGIVWHIVAGFWPSTAVIVTVVVMFFIAGFGVALGYHRLFTHRGYKCGPKLRAILAIAGASSEEGPPNVWIETHRLHHARTDRPGDAHSPFQYGGTKWLTLKGILWSHVGWLFYRYDLPVRDYQNDIDKDRVLQWLSKHYGLVSLVNLTIPAIVGAIAGLTSGGWHGMLIGSVSGFLLGMLRVVFFLNVTWCINSVSHLWGQLVAVYVIEKKGRAVNRTYYPSDGSRNAAWWLKWLSFGEANHALHHLFQKVAFHGWSKWAVDPAKWALIVLEKLHLVWSIERPPTHELVKVETAEQIDLPDDTFIPVGRLVPPAPAGHKELAQTG